VGSTPAGAVVASTRHLTEPPTHPTSKEAALPAHSTSGVETSGLVKTFGTTRAVDGVDLQVPAGSVYGVLGPNGAGKTTIIRILATLLRPDAGTARVFGHDVVADADAVRDRVSLTGQYASVDNDLTGRENLVLLARLLGFSRRQARTRAGELLDAFGLAEAADRLVGTYSGGMRRRLDITASLIVTPQLLVLCDGGWTSRPASSSPPSCWCSTSRPPGWIPTAATRSGISSGRWSPTAPRSCSPPSTWTRPISWPTGSL